MILGAHIPPIAELSLRPIEAKRGSSWLFLMTLFSSAVIETTHHLNFLPCLLSKSLSRRLTFHYSPFLFPLFPDPMAGVEALNSFCPTRWGKKGPGATPPSLWQHTINHVLVGGTGHLSQWPSPKTQTGQNKSPFPRSLFSTSVHIPSSWTLKIFGRSRWGQVPSMCLSFSISLSEFPILCPTYLNLFSSPTLTGNCSWQTSPRSSSCHRQCTPLSLFDGIVERI